MKSSFPQAGLLSFVISRFLDLARHRPGRLFRYLNPVNFGKAIYGYHLRRRVLGGVILGNKGRREKFDSNLWQKDAGLAQRKYESYEDYVTHQASKLEQIRPQLERTHANQVARFTSNFSQCRELQSARSVLCLGARLGAEVEAFRDLGYLAIGIDLNPGERNKFVLIGDFHDLQFADGVFDAVYCNTMDHVHNLNKILAEVTRVLAPQGLFVMDICLGYEEASLPGAYEAMSWPTALEFANKVAEISQMTLVRHGHLPDPPWTQAILRK